jgi:hypothetical protein
MQCDVSQFTWNTPSILSRAHHRIPLDLRQGNDNGIAFVSVTPVTCTGASR